MKYFGKKIKINPSPTPKKEKQEALPSLKRSLGVPSRDQLRLWLGLRRGPALALQPNDIVRLLRNFPQG